jgi:GTP cyclohydrolase II
LRLGFGDDERDFTVAAAMLRRLGQDRVRLLTNNPRKAAGIEAAGISVIEQVPLKAGENPHNEAYLATKRARSGHRL